ncbi:FeoA family protein [Cryomorpha ignava]|uniref:FeoA family protein n=1 Tax=Cryomorpha ignava TaxID=101383 RepID=UPI001952CBB5|nr:ferrous iron transport protein A [Cryomorpha ignava]
MASLTADIIQINETVEILDLDTNDLGQRLGEMGFWPGKSIQLLISAPFGDPLAFKVDNTIIALRKAEAKLIRVKVAITAA